MVFIHLYPNHLQKQGLVEQVFSMVEVRKSRFRRTIYLQMNDTITQKRSLTRIDARYLRFDFSTVDRYTSKASCLDRILMSEKLQIRLLRYQTDFYI